VFRPISSLTIAILLSLSLKAQDTIRLVHTKYTTVFSKTLKYPVLVEWWVTKESVSCTNPTARVDQFLPDPLLAAETNLAKDYTGSGFDRGHVAPAADNQCFGPNIMKETFYYSNMTPQYPQLNRGDWKKLETVTRDLAKSLDSIKVWSGSIGVQKKIGSLSVPTKCWKVLYIKKTNEWKAYIFDNTALKSDGIENNLVNIKQIEALTNFKFN
jgi:endonuclease G